MASPACGGALWEEWREGRGAPWRQSCDFATLAWPSPSPVTSTSLCKAAPRGGLNRGLGLHCHLLPLSDSRQSPLPASSSLHNMEPMGLKGPRVLCRFSLLCSLFLPALLPQPVTCAQVIPSTLSAVTSPGTRSGLGLRKRAQALMRDFPLVDGCVGATWGQTGVERMSNMRLLHTTPGHPISR